MGYMTGGVTVGVRRHQDDFTDLFNKIRHTRFLNRVYDPSQTRLDGPTNLHRYAA